MKIRICDENDVIAVHQQIQELKMRPIDFEQFQNAYLSLLHGNRYTFFVAEEDEKVVGFLSLIIDYLLYRSDLVGVIEELTVSEEYQSLGIGKALLQHATDYAKEKGCLLLELSSGLKREKAHAFYERQGFDKVGVTYRKYLKEESK